MNFRHLLGCDTIVTSGITYSVSITCEIKDIVLLNNF